LLGGCLGDEGAIDLGPIRAAFGRGALIRLVLRQADELQHFLGHLRCPWSRLNPGRRGFAATLSCPLAKSGWGRRVFFTLKGQK
jgi:hypothetical protein